MCASRLCNVSRKEYKLASGTTWELVGPDGRPIAAYDLFIDEIEDFAENTQKRYAEVISQLIDYLYEARILGLGPDDPLPTRKHIRRVIQAFPRLMRDGSALTVRKITDRIAVKPDHRDDEWLIEVAKKLAVEPHSRNSFNSIIAACNLFLRLSEQLAIEAKDIAELNGIHLPPEYTPLLPELQGWRALSQSEQSHIKENTVIGGLLRLCGPMKRPAGLKNPAAGEEQQEDWIALDFPLDHFQALLDAATSWRDRALWLLLLAAGLRLHEALNLLWCDIDYINQKVYVLDPNLRRYGKDMTPEEKVAFKGRTVSWTYLFEPYRTQFFEALREYRRREWRLPEDGDQHVFQYVLGGHEGEALVNATYQALNQSFLSAVTRAGIPGPALAPGQIWTLHSLRHAYGIYMRNYIPVAPGVFGLHPSDVQQLMGHKSIKSTLKYARGTRDRLVAKLDYADQAVLGLIDVPLARNQVELARLPRQLAHNILDQYGRCT